MTVKDKWLGLALIGLFMTAICLPLSVQFLQGDAETSNVEKRLLAKRPIFPRSLEEIKTFPGSFESYANDRFGLRDRLLRLYSRAKWTLGMEISKKAIVGKDGWFFLRQTDNVLAQYRGLDGFDQEGLANWVTAMEERRAWLAERGIPFIIVVAPNKHSVYPEYLPENVGGKVGESPLDQLTSYLRENSDLQILDLRSVVRQAKRKDQAFYKTDSHWSELGAFAGYTELTRSIKALFPMVEPQEFREYGLQNKAIKGDLVQMLNLDGVVSEQAKSMVLRHPSQVRKVLDLAKEKDAATGMMVFQTNRPSLPSAVVFCDSFIWGMANFLAETFDQTMLVHHQGLNFNPEIIDREKPDIVIFEIVERLLKTKIKKAL